MKPTVHTHKHTHRHTNDSYGTVCGVVMLLQIYIYIHARTHSLSHTYGIVWGFVSEERGGGKCHAVESVCVYPYMCICTCVSVSTTHTHATQSTMSPPFICVYFFLCVSLRRLKARDRRPMYFCGEHTCFYRVCFLQK